MSLTTDIYNALGVKLNAFAAAQSPALPVEYVGSPASFTPPGTGEWLEVRTFWNGNENYAWNTEDASVERGFFRISVISKDGGIPASQPIAELLATEFVKGTALATALVDTAPEIGGPFQEEDRLVTPVTVRWRATR